MFLVEYLNSAVRAVKEVKAQDTASQVQDIGNKVRLRHAGGQNPGCGME